MSSTFEIEIAPIGENGILPDYTTFGMKKSTQFDGKDYPIAGGTHLRVTRDRRTG